MDRPLPLELRPIAPADDAAVARIIREVMTSFGACGPGFAIVDPEVDAMSAAYAAPGAGYFVVTSGARVVGCGGYARLAGAGPEVCELRKMYFLPEARRRGAGRRMLDLILDRARRDGYATCYLETLVRMTDARRLYEAAGFAEIDRPMGSTGHFNCDCRYVRAL